MALSFPETVEKPHFEKTSFRVRKKIFVTLNADEDEAVLKLSEIDQDVYTKMSNGAIKPVPNKWGKQGWTSVNLIEVDPNLIKDVMKSAYCQVAPKKLSDLLSDE